MTTSINIAAWVLSGSSLGCTYLQGNGGQLGWALGIINSMFWIAYTLVTKQWGLIPLNAAMLIINVRNFYRNGQKLARVPDEA